jgi:hypothetical protein
MLPILPSGRKMGWKPRPIAAHAPRFAAVRGLMSVPLPVRASLRSHFPFVFDQKTLGSCTANSGSLVLAFLHGVKEPLNAPSRLDYYYKERAFEKTITEDAGAAISTGVQQAATHPICTEMFWPYVESKFAVKPYLKSLGPTIAGYEALASLPSDNVLLSSSYLANPKTDYRACIGLRKQPFLIGFTVFDSFDGEQITKTGIMPMPQPGEKENGGHAVTVIGYDWDFHNNPVALRSGLDVNKLPTKMYEVQNSWGSAWGDHGRFWMPAEFMENPAMANDAWDLQR